MNTLLYGMLGRQRYDELMRDAEDRRRWREAPSGGPLLPVGGLLIRFGRGLERVGARLSGSAAQGTVAGGIR